MKDDNDIKEVEKLMIIEQELAGFRKLLAATADQVLSKNVSKYPIFVMHMQEVAVGVPLVVRGKNKAKWSINASTLEEFAVKKLINESRIDEFRKTYKDPKTHLCVFVLSDMGAQFLFIPRKS